MKKKSIIYHGSKNIIRNPVFGAGNPFNDYGLGFYCTHDIELASEWACSEETGGFANKYELDWDSLSIMNLSGADYNVLNWLAILLNNRIFRVSNDIASTGKKFLLERFLPDTSKYDVLIGYRADDSYFSFANAFINNAISLAQLEKALYLGDLGEQTMIKTEAAFSNLHFLDYYTVERDIYYPKKIARDKAARVAYQTESELKQITDAIYLMDILRERWKNDDLRLRRNIS